MSPSRAALNGMNGSRFTMILSATLSLAEANVRELQGKEKTE
jgi:hypothetical protein